MAQGESKLVEDLARLEKRTSMGNHSIPSPKTKTAGPSISDKSRVFIFIRGQKTAPARKQKSCLQDEGSQASKVE